MAWFSGDIPSAGFWKAELMLAAGAFAMSHDDIADSLPGVAISISLVPPLCVVRISLSSGQWSAAGGAMMLFLTNFFSIILAGGGVLALLGLGFAATQNLAGHARRNAFVIIALGLLLVTISLASTSIRVKRETVTEYKTIQTVQEWLAQTDYEPESIDAYAGDVRVGIFGEGELPPREDLVSALETRNTPEGILDLVIIPVQKEQHEVDSQRE